MLYFTNLFKNSHQKHTNQFNKSTCSIASLNESILFFCNASMRHTINAI